MELGITCPKKTPQDETHLLINLGGEVVAVPVSIAKESLSKSSTVGIAPDVVNGTNIPKINPW